MIYLKVTLIIKIYFCLKDDESIQLDISTQRNIAALLFANSLEDFLYNAYSPAPGIIAEYSPYINGDFLSEPCIDILLELKNL